MTHERGEARSPEPSPEAPVQAAAPGLAPAGAGMTPARVLALQRSAGNQAVRKLLRVDTPTTRSGVSSASYTIADYFVNAQTAPKREEALRALLLNHDRAAELRSTYQAEWGRDLDRDLATLPRRGRAAGARLAQLRRAATRCRRC